MRSLLDWLLFVSVMGSLVSAYHDTLQASEGVEKQEAILFVDNGEGIGDREVQLENEQIMQNNSSLENGNETAQLKAAMSDTGVIDSNERAIKIEDGIEAGSSDAANDNDMTSHDIGSVEVSHESNEASLLVDDDLKEDAIVSIDTTDLGEPQGNWFFKRYWYNKANKIYERITRLVNEVFQERPRFMAKRSELEHELFDPFYINVGIKQGELRGVVSFLVDHLKPTSSNVYLSEREVRLLNKLKEHKAIVDQLYNDIEDINQIDRTVDQAIDALMDQLNLARNYKQEAWNYFKSIERELSDQKAREFVFAMRAMEKNIKDILTYLTGSFSSFFTSLTDRAREEINRIQFAITELKEKGIDLKEEAEYLELLDKASPEETKEVVKIGLLGRLWNSFGAFFSRIWNFITGLFKA